MVRFLLYFNSTKLFVMNRNSLIFSILLVGVVLFKSCIPEAGETPMKSLVLDTQSYDYVIQDGELPSHIQAKKSALDNTPEDNLLNNDIVALGRALFYDERMSLNNTTSCAGCHLQQNAFSDISAGSAGFNGGVTQRNSMPLFNNAFHKNFFWDNEAQSLEDQVVMPIKDHLEMGLESPEFLEAKISSIDEYDALFTNAFGTDEVSHDRVAKSLAQFIRSIVSYRSKFDQGLENQFTAFSAQEREGMKIFFDAQCNSCHNLVATSPAPMTFSFGFDDVMFFNNFDDFSMPDFNESPKDAFSANVGLEMNYADKGMGALTGDDSENGRFKIPSLRNIAVTAPYMHDGRFSDLRTVLDHYDEGISAHENLDSRLRNGGGNSYDELAGGASGTPLKFQFDDEEKEAIIAFFNTLTDEALLEDPKYSNPWSLQ